MLVRNVDLLQDRWHAEGRYQRAEHLHPHTRALIDRMYPPTAPERHVKGYSAAYIERLADRCCEAIADDALTAQEVAEAVGVSVHSVVKALGVAVATGRLERNNAATGRSVRYWNTAGDA